MPEGIVGTGLRQLKQLVQALFRLGMYYLTLSCRCLYSLLLAVLSRRLGKVKRGRGLSHLSLKLYKIGCRGQNNVPVSAKKQQSN